MPYISRIRDLRVFLAVFFVVLWNAEMVIPILISAVLHLAQSALAATLATTLWASFINFRLVVPFGSLLAQRGHPWNPQQQQQQPPQEQPNNINIDHNNNDGGDNDQQQQQAQQQHQHQQQQPPPQMMRAAAGGWIVFAHLEDSITDTFSNILLALTSLITVAAICPIYSVPFCTIVGFISGMFFDARNSLSLLFSAGTVSKPTKIRVVIAFLALTIFTGYCISWLLEASVWYKPENPVAPARKHPIFQQHPILEFSVTGTFFDEKRMWEQFKERRLNGVRSTKPIPRAPYWDLGIGSMVTEDGSEVLTNHGRVDPTVASGPQWLGAGGATTSITVTHVQTALALLLVDLCGIFFRLVMQGIVTTYAYMRGHEEVPAPGDDSFYFERLCARLLQFGSAAIVALQTLGVRPQLILVQFMRGCLSLYLSLPTSVLHSYCTMIVIFTHSFDFTATADYCVNRHVTETRFLQDWLGSLAQVYSSTIGEDATCNSSNNTTTSSSSSKSATAIVPTIARMPWFWQLMLILCIWRFLGWGARWHEWRIIMGRFPVLTPHGLRRALWYRSRRTEFERMMRDRAVREQEERRLRHERRQREAAEVERALSVSVPRDEQNNNNYQQLAVNFFRSPSPSAMPPLPSGDDLTCVVCLAEVNPHDGSGRILRCGHFFHSQCLSRTIAHFDPVDVARCPTCRRLVFESVSPGRPPAFVPPPFVPPQRPVPQQQPQQQQPAPAQQQQQQQEQPQQQQQNADEDIVIVLDDREGSPDPRPGQ